MSAPKSSDSFTTAPKSSDSFTNWFFSRMRRLLSLNAVGRQKTLPAETTNTDTEKQKQGKNEENTAENSEGHDDWMVDLRRSVKRLHFGNWEEKEAAAGVIKKLAEEGLKRRRTMAELGVIPPLVAMVGSEVVGRQRLAVRALTELANGSFRNRALMVEAGILSKLPQNIGFLDENSRQEFAQLLFFISALYNTQITLNSSRIIPIIASILDSNPNTTETRESCLTTLYNLSSLLDNIGPLVSTGIVNTLITFSSVKELSEKSLATLSNLVVTLEGKKALENNQMVPESLIEIMSWEDKPKSQELSAYILMILAHQSLLQREKMAKAGIVQVLLEVALLGSPLAQKRAVKILQWFKDERQMKMGPHSGPQMGRVSMGSPVNERDIGEGKKLMKKIVKQSLYKNLERITRRANGDSSKLKSLVISSSSKSLPY